MKTGSERAAIFLMSLGEKEAAEVMKHMPVADVQRLGKAMAALRNVSRADADSVLQGFTDGIEQGAPITDGSPGYLKRLLTSSLGEDRADQMLDRIVDEGPQGLESLQLMEAKEIAGIVLREHPQVTAVVLAGLDAQKAARVIDQLPVALATEVITRVARMDEIPQETLAELDEAMQHMFTRSPGLKLTRLGGVGCAAGILNRVGKPVESGIIEILTQRDQPLCTSILDNMFVFENLLRVDDRGIQALIREITPDVLLVALKGAEPALKEKIFANMSKRAAEILQSDLEAKGPVRLADVEAAQKDIVATARRLAEEGTIQIGASDEFV